MVRAYHVIFTTYGFWLPNDPRGSWSDWVRSWELSRHGPATKVDTRRSVAANLHDHLQRRAAKEALRYPPVVFTGRRAQSIARGFATAVGDADYILHACSILPQHVHAVIGRDGRHAEQIVAHLKRAASRRLREDGLHPLLECARTDETLPSPWARKCWKVYRSESAEIRRAVRYVLENPLREGKRPQQWSFVVPYDR